MFGCPISKFQNSQFKIVEMATEIKLGRTFLDKLVVDHMEGKNIVVEVSMAKDWTTEMAMRVADRCMHSTADTAIVRNTRLREPGET